MDSTKTISLDQLHLHCKWYFIGWIICISIVFRIFISMLRALEYQYFKDQALATQTHSSNQAPVIYSKPFLMKFYIVLKGIDDRDPYPDLFYNTALGFIELAIFPFLLTANQYGIIGGWIALKSVAQWKIWTEKRYVFNRFLIATAILVLTSFGLKKYVYIDNSSSQTHPLTITPLSGQLKK